VASDCTPRGPYPPACLISHVSHRRRHRRPARHSTFASSIALPMAAAASVPVRRLHGRNDVRTIRCPHRAKPIIHTRASMVNSDHTPLTEQPTPTTGDQTLKSPPRTTTPNTAPGRVGERAAPNGIITVFVRLGVGAAGWAESPRLVGAVRAMLPSVGRHPGIGRGPCTHRRRWSRGFPAIKSVTCYLPRRRMVARRKDELP
jgi:hypothetical protein